MNCADFEKLFALEAEGDLPEKMAGGLAAHVRACRQCQEFAVKLETSQSLLKELGKEAPDEATLQELRRSILNRLPSRDEPKAFPVWPLALGAALAMILILAVIMLRHPAHAPAKGVIASKQLPITMEATRHTPQLPAPSSARKPRATKAVRVRKSPSALQRASAKRQHAEPLMVKLLTDNPRVVIYWFVD